MDIFEEILEEMHKDPNLSTNISDRTLVLLSECKNDSFLFPLKYTLFGTWMINKLLIESKITVDQYTNIQKMITSNDQELKDLAMELIKGVKDEYNTEDKKRHNKGSKDT